MLDDKKISSRMRTFRFNDAMEKDLSFLSDLWGCTATDAIARALTNVVTLERMYIVQTSVKHDEADKQALWRAEMEHRIYSQPLASLQSLSASTDEVVQSDPIQPQTATQIEKPAPSTPIIKEAPVSVPANAAGESAASVPAPTDGGIDGKRYQVKIFVRNNPMYSKKPKAHSGETAALAEKRAADWLREQGYTGIETKIPAGKHCKTIRI